jgi:hypothetical protein
MRASTIRPSVPKWITSKWITYSRPLIAVLSAPMARQSPNRVTFEALRLESGLRVTPVLLFQMQWNLT